MIYSIQYFPARISMETRARARSGVKRFVPCPLLCTIQFVQTHTRVCREKHVVHYTSFGNITGCNSIANYALAITQAAKRGGVRSHEARAFTYYMHHVYRTELRSYRVHIAFVLRFLYTLVRMVRRTSCRSTQKHDTFYTRRIFLIAFYTRLSARMIFF